MSVKPSEFTKELDNSILSNVAVNTSVKEPIWINNQTRLNESNMNNLRNRLISYSDGTLKATYRQLTQQLNKIIARTAGWNSFEDTDLSFSDPIGVVFNDYNNNTATGKFSATFGTGTKAVSEGQFVIGKYNGTDDAAIFIIGDGTSDTNRSNLFSLNKDGQIKSSKTLSIVGRLAVSQAPSSSTHVVRKKELDDLRNEISGALHYIGKTTTELSDGSSTNPVAIYDVETKTTTNITAVAGDVVLINGTQDEFIFDGKNWSDYSAYGNYVVRKEYESNIDKIDENISTINQTLLNKMDKFGGVTTDASGNVTVKTSKGLSLVPNDSDGTTVGIFLGQDGSDILTLRGKAGTIVDNSLTVNGGINSKSGPLYLAGGAIMFTPDTTNKNLNIDIYGSKELQLSQTHLDIINKRILNVLTPEADLDAANKKYVDDRTPPVDQTYSRISKNAQSGKAVAEAIAEKPGQKTPAGGEIFNDYENNIAGSKAFGFTVAGTTFNEQYAQPTISTTVEVAEALSTGDMLSGKLVVTYGNVKNNTIIIESINSDSNEITVVVTDADTANNANEYLGTIIDCDLRNSTSVTKIKSIALNIVDGIPKATATVNSVEGFSIGDNVEVNINNYGENFAVIYSVQSIIDETAGIRDGLIYINIPISIASQIDINNLDAKKSYLRVITKPNVGELTIGEFTIASGKNTKALSDNAEASGQDTIASGVHSRAEGVGTFAGAFSHAEGFYTIASQMGTHSEGVRTQANGFISHAEGIETIANGTFSHTEGQKSKANGWVSHAEGYDTNASGGASHTEGVGTQALEYTSHAEGEETISSGQGSHSEGRLTKATAMGSHAEGNGAYALGIGSHAEGTGIAQGDNSHAEGGYEKVENKGDRKTAYHNKAYVYGAIGQNSHAEGQNTMAVGRNAHTEGQRTIALGNNTHAQGAYTYANGENSFAAGEVTIANGKNQFVVGQYNDKDACKDALFVVGNGHKDGSDESTRVNQNAFMVNKDGSAKIQTQGIDDNSVVIKKYVDDAIENAAFGGISDNYYTRNEVYTKNETEEKINTAITGYATETYVQDNIKEKADKNKILDYITYEIENGEVAITGCDKSISGAHIIPDIIEGYIVTSIGENAFSNCSGLTSITIPNSVTSIGYWAFRSCTSLTNIIIPDSVNIIDEYAFYNCTGLTSIIISNGVTSIGDSAFKYCSALTSITIPESVTSIGDEAFKYCSALTSVTIPNSVKTIASDVFEVKSLTDIYYMGSEEDWNYITIDGTTPFSALIDATIHYNQELSNKEYVNNAIINKANIDYVDNLIGVGTSIEEASPNNKFFVVIDEE